MKMKIALAALACSGSLLAFLSTSASAAPLSGLSQSHHGVAMADHPLLQKVHRWWRRGWGGGAYYGYGYGYGYGNGYSYYRSYPAYAPYYYGAYYAPPPPPPPYYYYRPYWGPYY